MADNKWEGGKRRELRIPRDDEDLQRRAQDGSGRDPTARRGEIEEGGSVSDEDVGADEIQRKAIGGYGADTGESARGMPLSDDSSGVKAKSNEEE